MFRTRTPSSWMITGLCLGFLLSLSIAVFRSTGFPVLADSGRLEMAAIPSEVDPKTGQVADPMPDSGVELADHHWQRAIAAATIAATQAQNAITADAWDQVAVGWTTAISELQRIPTDSPQRLFSQRKIREYLTNLQVAQQRAEAAGARAVFPTLGSPVLDEQVALYQSYVATLGVPDVLVVGSSRSLQGIDSLVLQQALAQQGFDRLRVYNLSVNGATAQVVSFILRQLLLPEQLPRLIVWGDGSRAFNSGRVDRTFAKILDSPGYAAVQASNHPTPETSTDTPLTGPPSPLSISAIGAYGFLPVGERFSPASYYQTTPRVSGRYDDAYQPFDLSGVQQLSLAAIATFLNSQQIPLVLVNLPLSGDYLDEVRLYYERQFQQYLQQQAQQRGFTVIDLMDQWVNADQYFADPSHLNQLGAAAIARQLATHRQIPWVQLQSAPETDPEEPNAVDTEA
jgi:hypothetical protein